MTKTQAEFLSGVLQQVIVLQQDGYGDFSFKTGNEPNPNNNDVLEECIVVDMTQGDQAKSVNFFYA